MADPITFWVAVKWLFKTVILPIALSVAASKLLRKKQTGSRDNNVTFRQSDFPRRLVYGRKRVSTLVGDIIIYRHGENRNDIMRSPYILCDGPIEEVETIYFNDKPVDLEPNPGDNRLVTASSDAVTTGDYDEHSYIKINTGAADQTMADGEELRLVASRGDLLSNIRIGSGRDEGDGLVFSNYSGSAVDGAGAERSVWGGNYIPKINYDGRHPGLITYELRGTRAPEKRAFESIADYEERLKQELADIIQQTAKWAVDGSIMPFDYRSNQYDVFPWGTFGPTTIGANDNELDLTYQNRIPRILLHDRSRFDFYFRHLRHVTPPLFWYHFPTHKIYRYDQSSQQYVFWKWIDGREDESVPLPSDYWDNRLIWQDRNDGGNKWYLRHYDTIRPPYDPDRPNVVFDM